MPGIVSIATPGHLKKYKNKIESNFITQVKPPELISKGIFFTHEHSTSQHTAHRHGISVLSDDSPIEIRPAQPFVLENGT